MDILLWQTVDKLGERGEVVDVAPGYARNYLFRKGWATRVSEEQRKRLNQEQERLEREERKRIQENERLLEKIESVYCVLRVESNEEGHLYGSVTPTDIATQIASEEDIDVEPKHFVLKEPIKEVGTYEVGVNLHPEVKGTLFTWVVQSEEGE